MKKRVKITALVTALFLLTAMLAGCGGQKDSGKVSLTVGNWPTEAQERELQVKTEFKQQFEQEHPELEMKTDNYAFDVKTFAAKAAAKQLPDIIYNLPYTEVKTVIRNGYASDMTEAAKRKGLLDALDPEMMAMCSDEDGNVYCLPRVAYMMGLMVNKKLFAQAGLVNEDGTVKFPENFEQLTEYAQIIKEKTGAAGFCMPSTNNVGGWILTCIAYNFGVEFEKQNDDGSWTATFDTPEFHKTLEWLYDMKWNKNVLQDNTVVDATEMQMQLGSDRAAMVIGNSDWCNKQVTTCGMAKDNIAMAKMPAGDGGRYAMLGGSLFMFAQGLSEEQKDLALDWIALSEQFTADVDKEGYAKQCQSFNESGYCVFPRELFTPWISPERAAIVEEASAPYVNMNIKDFEEYNRDGIELRTEPEACAQQLYSVLDGVVQRILTDQNVNLEEISKKAQEDFQANFLDKMD